MLLDSYIGKYLDPDKEYAFQCMDVIVQYGLDLSNFRFWGNARDSLKNKLPEGWTIHINTPDFMPKVGDIGVCTLGEFNNEFGHIFIVYDDVSLESCIVIEQNWNGKANTPVKKRKCYYEGVSHFIRPLK
ncbi:CHAP domain-containing protein [Macrococcus capreoli]